MTVPLYARFQQRRVLGAMNEGRKRTVANGDVVAVVREERDTGGIIVKNEFLVRVPRRYVEVYVGDKSRRRSKV